MSARDEFLAEVAAQLPLPDDARREVLEELAAHLADSTAELVARGRDSGAAEREAWKGRFGKSDRAANFAHAMSGKLPEDFAATMAAYKTSLAKTPPHIATRNASQNALDVINVAIPETLGGSADLTGSNNTKSKDMKPFTAADRRAVERRHDRLG